MSFFAKSFIYDGVPSDTYGLFISNIDASAVNESMGSNAMTIYEQKLYRRATPYFYGASPSNNLSFEMSAFSEGELTAGDFELVQKWLFSSRRYKKLQIVQEDMYDVYFNCILNEPRIVRVGNIIQGFSCTVNCDSPFAFLFPKTTTYTYSVPIVDTTIVFNNSSDDNDGYLYPSNVITMNEFGGDLTIVNTSDSNRTSSFTGLSPNEVITIDNSLQTLSSSTGLLRLDKFNKKFLRLIPGINILTIKGSVSSITMTTQFISKKIGG